MTLDVLDDATLARLGRIEVWVSLYWDEPYNTEGEFTLEVRPTEENLSLLREGRYLKRSDSDLPMRICHRSNENSDANLVVKGFPVRRHVRRRDRAAHGAAAERGEGTDRGGRGDRQRQRRRCRQESASRRPESAGCRGSTGCSSRQRPGGRDL